MTYLQALISFTNSRAGDNTPHCPPTLQWTPSPGVSALYLRADLVEDAVKADMAEMVMREQEKRKKERDRYDDIE